MECSYHRIGMVGCREQATVRAAGPGLHHSGEWGGQSVEWGHVVCDAHKARIDVIRQLVLSRFRLNPDNFC